MIRAQESSVSKAETNTDSTKLNDQSSAKSSSKTQANSTRANSSANSSSANSSREPSLTPVQIQRAKEFAATHHPELGELLGRLESYDEPSFVEAIQELLRTMDRLEKLSEKNTERGRVELEDWKLTSRIRLLAARLAMADALPVENLEASSRTIKQEIRELLIERAELRKSSLTAERLRLQDRLEKVNRQLSELSERERQNIERELDRLEANASQAKTRQKAAQKEKSSLNTKPRSPSNAPQSDSTKQAAEKPAKNNQKP
ncbi:hypothetical protein [Planctopirus ephydatiae]|nr:hypothetical protein [Planctopirus ephydatiae]